MGKIDYSMWKRYKIEKNYIGELFTVVKNNSFSGDGKFDCDKPFMLLKGEADVDMAGKSDPSYLEWYLLYESGWVIAALQKTKVFHIITKKIFLLPVHGTFEEQFLVAKKL